MSDYLTDTEKFAVMAMEYGEIFHDQAHFANKISVSKQSLSLWYRRIGVTINTQARIKICDAFNLQHTVWTEVFEDETNFRHSLPEYQKILKPISIEEEQQKELDIKIIGTGKELTGNEKDMLTQLASESNLDLLSIEIERKSPIFLFELSKIFKDKNQILEALEIVSILQNTDSTFKYTFHNDIEHFKAVLFSHSQIQKWDEAINTLRLLYSASHYHLVEPEIITLLASNYKRKALSSSNGGWMNRDNVDIDLLASAFSLYSDAYKLKSVDNRYYDAVNMAYLINIINTIESSEEESLTALNLYSELSSKWNIDDSNWWEVSSDAEFLMLLGKTDIAILKVNDFLEFSDEGEEFDVETTLRQLEMYLHFVDDDSGKLFYSHLKKSWEQISLNNL